MEVFFELEKVTKNTIRFAEVLNGPLDTPKVGTIYVPKTTLQQIGYTEGKQLKVTLATN